MPSWPVLLTVTCAPDTGTPLIPAMKLAVCVAAVPMRMMPDSPATPRSPMSILLLPVVRFMPASKPTAMLLLPVLRFEAARVPKAVFWKPLVLFVSAA